MAANAPAIVDRWFWPTSRTGPIGVAMEIMTWCAVLGTGWVITACVEAVLWQRTAPTDTVLQAQTAA